MTIKDLFGKQSNKLVTSQDSGNVSNEVESKDLVRAEIARRNTFVPKVDFGDPKNFANHGSAEKYYADTITHIYNTYPYDGSEAEQVEWHNSASFIDNYLFDNGYPKSTGYVTLNATHTIDTTVTGPSASNEIFKLASSPQYVTFRGGPHTASADGTGPLSNLFGDSKTNIYKTSDNRTSNLDISHDLGNTVEFWYKVGSVSALSEQSTCVFDMWNQARLDESNYGRIMVEVLGPHDGNGHAYPTSGSFAVSYRSGSYGADRILVGSGSAMPINWSFTDWHHYAFTFKSDTVANNTKVKFYVDGDLITETTVATTAIATSIDRGWQASLGAYLEGPIVDATSSVNEGYGTYEDASYDEFRFWKKARTEKDIKRNWFKQVRGGTNTDDANVELGVYYKFNEGIVNLTSSVAADASVLDYSGRISNGDIINYSLTVRNTGSALTDEHRDPIIRSNNYQVVDYKSSMESIGKTYDLGNHTSIMNSIPKWITDIDEENGSTVLKNLVQIVSSYFDTLQLQIEALPNIKNSEYNTMQSGSVPYHFMREAVASMGMLNPDLFVEATVLEEISSRNETGKYNENIQDIKNVIYQNIYNNLPFIYKSKGTEKSFRNLIRCFGIDDEILKVNMYANDVDFTFNEDNSRTTSYKKQYVNFNSTGSFDAVVYQAADATNPNSTGFIKGQTTSNLDFVPYTLQCEAYFPKKYSSDITETFSTNFMQSSIFGLHGARTDDDLAFPADDAGNFQVSFVRSGLNEQGGYFLLEFSGSGVDNTTQLTSQVYKNVYDNEKWNLAVRLAPTGAISDITPGSSGAPTYKLEFYGVNSVSNTVQNEFSLSTTIDNETAKKVLNKSKRVFVGAHRTNITGAVLLNSDVNVSSVRFWFDYLDDETIKYHSHDAATYGRIEPYKPAHFTISTLTGSHGGISIPEIETLVLHWNFQNLSGSDGSGELTVLDYSSGSSTPYGWFGDDYKSKHHTGKGYGFPASYDKAVVHKYVESLKTSQPETLNSSDMVKILTQDDEFFTRDTVPVKYYFSIEKSMYQTISDEMVKVFAGLRYFNDLIGHPVNRYRMEYKDLRKLRQLFFNGVENTPSLEKYVDFYKWIDSSIGSMIQELFPASANYSASPQTMIESHILERNKYWNKLSGIKEIDIEPEGQAVGIYAGSPPYPWKYGHSPESGYDGVTNTVYSKHRIERTDSRISSGDANVDADRETIRKAILRNAKGSTQRVNRQESGTRLYDTTTQATYEASTYVTRHLSRPYRFSSVIQNSIKGGVNRHVNKIPPFEFVRTATDFKSPTSIRTDSAVVNDNSQDDAALYTKFKADSNSVNNRTASGSVNPSKGSLLNPFSEYAETVTGTPKITNNLFDSYGKDGETPAQGPFTNAHVGGSQHRHTDMNRGTTLDTVLTRAELYTDTDNSETASDLRHPAHNSSAVPSARYFRDELAKRPVNIRNIKFTTGSFNIGNYSKDYQVVSTTGRSAQNRWFYKNNGEISITGSVSSTAVIGVKDFTLPDRSKDSLGNNFGTSDHVIVQRFSAPGGPDSISRRTLDGESEEYSPYNTINYRNLLVRQFLNKKHQTHCGIRGYVAGTTTGSYHKVQRNSSRRVQLTGSLDFSHIQQKVTHDNFFVNHSIPRSEYQYAWITASAVQPEFPGNNDTFARFGFSSKYLNVQTTASFSLTGSLNVGTATMEIDFAGLNTTVYDPHSIKRDTTGYPNSKFFADIDHRDYVHQFLADTSVTSVKKSKQLNALLLHRNGPYQYPSWKQIRTGERPLARNLRKENLIVVHDDVKMSNNNGTEKLVRTVHRLKEPVVTWNIPMETYIKTSESDSEVYKVKHSYRNNLEMFANPNLSNLINPEKSRKDRRSQPYDKLLELYDNDDNPVVFKSLIYKENIFPKHRNAGLKRTRSRMNYEESEDTLRKSPGVIRTFWRYNQNDRIKPNRSSNALDTKFSIQQIDDLKQLDSFWALDHFYVDIGSNTYEVLGDLAYAGINRYRSWITGEFLSHEASPPTSVATAGDFSSAGAFVSRGKNSDALVGAGYQSNDYLDQDISSATGYKYPSNELISRNSQFNNNPDAAAYAASSFNDEGDSVDPILMFDGGFTGMSSGDAPNSLDGASTNGGVLMLDPPINADFMADNGYTLSQNPGADGILAGPDFELITEVDGFWDITEDSTTTISNDNVFTTHVPVNPGKYLKPSLTTLPPRPAIQFYYQPFHSILGESAMKWKTSDLSGKKPWYDTYENYSEEIQRMGQNYSIIPEFRISKHIPYYVQNKKGNFASDNYGFLTLEGSGDHVSEHDSAEKKITFKKLYSRDGIGADDIAAYPTASEDFNTNNIQNNAWYEYVNPDGDVTNTTFKNYNNVYAAGTFTIDNSVMTVYNITKTLPTTELNSSGADWKSISPYQTKNAGVNLNTETETDYLISTIEKINTNNSSSISLQQEGSSGEDGTPFCVSFWATLDSKSDDSNYVGAWNISMGDGPDQWLGMWLKCPKAKNWGGSTKTRGITVFTSLSGSQPDTARLDADVGYDENIYEFFNSDGTEAILTPGALYHIMFEFVPRGTTSGISPAYIRVFLNGERLYGKHIRYANQDSSNSGVAYSAVPMGANAPWNVSRVYGDSINQHGYNKLTDLQIGKSNPDSVQDGHYYYGFMDEFSMWYGTLTSDDATRMNYYGQPSNLIEEYANSEIAGTTGSWDYEFGARAPKIGYDGGVTYTIPTSSYTFRGLELFQWARLGVPFSVKPDALQVDYSEEFFNKYCHTDFIKYFDKVTSEHSQEGTKTKLRLKVNAVKKLLPYNGFYPSQRTTQMAYLFKESYKNSITLRNVHAPYNKEGLHRSQAFQSLLQPFFAPGLLYNTIKSGIAVDYPIFTNTSGKEPSRPFPIMDAFDKNNNYEPTKFNLAAPSWYIKQDITDPGIIGQPGVSYDPDAIALAKKSFELSQPKYNIGQEYGTDGEGFVIISEPSARLDFDKLLNVESAFFNEGSVGHLATTPVDRDLSVFQNSVVEFRGYECEGNSIVLRQPIIEEQQVVGFKDSTIQVVHDSELNFNETTLEHTPVGATISIDFLETEEAEVSQLIAKRVIEYINNNNDLDFIAVGPGVTGPENTTDAAFRQIEKAICKPDELGAFSDFYRIRIVYTGPLNLTVQDKIDLDGTGDLEIIYNQIINSDPTAAQLVQTEDDVRDLPLPKFYYVRVGNQAIRTESFFTAHNRVIRSNGFGDSARISFEDSAVEKQNGVTGILGIRYVNEAGSTSSDSDSPNYTPMLQLMRPLYGGRTLSESDASVGETVSIGSRKLKKKPHQVFLMTPSYYTGSVGDEDWYRNTRFPYFEWSGRTSNPLYKMAMHNFLAETPKFFLKNRGMTTIASSPQNKFKKMQIGKKYYMDIVMYSEGVHTTYSPYDGQIFTQYPGSGDSEKEKRSVIGRTQGRYYGDAYKYMNHENYTDSGQLIQDPAYAPNTPPYFYGRTVCRVVYTADRENPTIDDIHRDMELNYIDDEVLQKFVMAAMTSSIYDPARLTSDAETYGIKDSPAYKARMKLEASINFKAKTRLKNISYDVTDSTQQKFNPVAASDSNTPEDDVWVITPKFECPVLNFDPASTINETSFDYKDLTDGNDVNKGTSGTGMWHGYGEVPAGNSGIFLSLEESFKFTFGSDKLTDENGEEVGSLIEACGFETQTSKIGEIADERKVSEAIIMIPFIDNVQEGKAETISVINKNFIKISKDVYEYQKSNVEKGKPAVAVGDYGATENIQETSISRMAKLMKKYNIPPKFDFETYDRNPFVMYIFEFNHTFDQQDLSDIWQGVLPKIGIQARYSDNEDDNEIVHELGPHDFFEGQDMPSNVRWLTFKVKQKGEKSFYNITADSRDDSRFKFDFQVGNRTPEYSYNWPYDYFSLVELANIEGGVIIETDEDE